MRLSSDVAALLRELDRASLDGYGTDFVVLSKDHTPYVRNKARESGWIEAQGRTNDRVYRITADGRKALAQNAEGWKNGEPAPERADALIRADGSDWSAPTPAPRMEYAPIKAPVPALPTTAPDCRDQEVAALKAENANLRKDNLRLFGLLSSAHSLATKLLLKLVAVQPDMSSIVGEYEQLSTKLDEETQK